MTTVRLSIIVYKGSPLDYSHYRHTALWCRFADQSPSLLVHVVGPVGEFEFESREESQPWETRRYARRIDVGMLTVAATRAQTEALLQRIPINNRNREFNFQTWVEAALRTFADTGALSRQDYDRGLDVIVDAIAEAEDVEG